MDSTTAALVFDTASQDADFADMEPFVNSLLIDDSGGACAGKNSASSASASSSSASAAAATASAPDPMVEVAKAMIEAQGPRPTFAEFAKVPQRNPFSATPTVQALLAESPRRREFEQRHFDRADANHDAVLQFVELRGAVANMCEELGVSLPSSSKIDQLFAACDANHDGGLSKAEFALLVKRVLRAAEAKLASEVAEAEEQLRQQRGKSYSKLAEAELRAAFPPPPQPMDSFNELHDTWEDELRAKKELALLNSAAAGKISGMTGMALNGIESRVDRLLAGGQLDKGLASSLKLALSRWTKHRATRKAAAAQREREAAEPWNWKGQQVKGRKR